MARTCASVKVPSRDVPRWPLVPNATNWLGSSRSGLRPKYSLSNLASSTSISRGAGLPARGERRPPLDCVSARFVSSGLGMRITPQHCDRGNQRMDQATLQVSIDVPMQMACQIGPQLERLFPFVPHASVLL